MYHSLIYEASKLVDSYYHSMSYLNHNQSLQALQELHKELINTEQVTPCRELLIGIEQTILELFE